MKRFLSLKYLAALGFLIAALPLAIAVGRAVSAVEEIAELGQRAIYQVLEQSKTARQLIQRVNDIERKARFFTLLSDPSLREPYDRESYENVRTALRQTLDTLRALNQDENIRARIDTLVTREQQIYDQVVATEAGNPEGDAAENVFRPLRTAADDLRRAVAGQVDQEVSRLQVRSGAVQRGLLASASLLIPLSIGLIIVLLSLFVRTIRLLDRAVWRLGTGDFAEPIRVSGPLDLQYLGERLEWLREHLLQLEKSKQQFMRNVSHDIKTPLSTVSEGSELLLEGIIGELDPARAKAARAIIAASTRLENLVEELIRYGQLTSESLEESREQINMLELVREALASCLSQLEAKSLTVRELLQTVMVQGVRDQLRTLLMSLLSNAVKFSPAGGEIRIILRTAGGNMELEVEDDGPGFDPSELERVFEPFFLGTAGRAGVDQGSGVGLAIASECVASHQGSIEILEPRQGKQGARLRVHIPLPRTAE